METTLLNNTLLSIWRNQPKAFQSIRREIDLEIQKKVLSVFSVGEFYYYIFDVLKGSFEYVSPDVESVMGFLPSDYTLEGFLERIHPEDQQFMQNCENTVMNFFKRLSPEKFFNYKIRYDYRVKKRNGDYARILQQVLTINYSPEGTVLHTFGIHTDITHLKTKSHPNLSFIGLNGEPSFIDYPIENYVHPKHPTVFSMREQEILAQIWEGLDSTEIADRLFISKNTVDTHRRTMLNKSGARNAVELLRFALKNGEL
jgi:DNA-binding CsgD family transcriptional regulator